MKRFPIAHIILLICLLTTLALAQNTTIRGRVVDKESGDGLPGANVIVPGTYKGAATDADGYFVITGLAPGDYDIKASMIGYTEQLQTGIQVRLNRETEVNFEMTPTVLALGQTLEVIGEKPLFESDVTASQQRLSSDEIGQKVVETVDDLVGDQLGVVVQDNKIHIRGGRADESMYIIDGQSIKDPLSGYTNTLYVNAAAIEELKVITGGFDAEYGQAMSGVVDIATKEGGSYYSGNISLKSDNWLSSVVQSYNTDILQFNIGGPEPITSYLLDGIFPGDLTLFASGYGHLTDTYLPRASELFPKEERFDPLAPRQENDWHLMGKIAWKPQPGQKLSLSYDQSMNINQGYFLPRIDGGRGYPYE